MALFIHTTIVVIDELNIDYRHSLYSFRQIGLIPSQNLKNLINGVIVPVFLDFTGFVLVYHS